MKQLRIIILALLLPAFAFATPNNPSNLTFTYVTSHSVTLNWEDNSEDETGFKILVNGKYLLKTAPNKTHFTVGSLRPDTRYEFTVKATDSNYEHNRATISTDSQTYNEYEDIVVNIKNLVRDADNNNWVGIYPKDASNDWGNKLDWNRPLGKTSLTFEGIAAGEYEARLFYSSSFELLEKVGFSVGDNNLNRIYPPEGLLTKKVVDGVERPPEKFSSYIDNSFNDNVKRIVTRLTNREKDKKFSNGHSYPKQGTAWNSDMTLLRINQRIYDAKELYELPLTENKNADNIMKGPQSSSAGIRWSKDDPNTLYVMSKYNIFYKLTITKEKTEIKYEVIYDFSNLGKGQFTIGHGEGNIDNADRYVVLSATSGNSIYAVLLDIKAKDLVWEPKKLKYPVKTNGKSDFDWISISPSGKYILVSSNECTGCNECKGCIDLYDALTFKMIKRLTTHAGHGDIGTTSNNEDIYVQWEHTGYNGFILKNQQKIVLLDFKVGSAHISCRNYDLKNWCYVSSDKNGFREVFALKLDGSMNVRRFAKTHAKGPEDPESEDQAHRYYYTMPFGIPSPDGTKILFWSDYGNPDKHPYYDKVYEDNNEEYKLKTTNHWDRRDTYQVEITK